MTPIQLYEAWALAYPWLTALSTAAGSVFMAFLGDVAYHAFRRGLTAAAVLACRLLCPSRTVPVLAAARLAVPLARRSSRRRPRPDADRPGVSSPTVRPRVPVSGAAHV